MGDSKIRIKLGAIEIEYEGSESFLKEELPQFLSAVTELYSKSHDVLSSDSGDSGSSKPAANTKLQATTSSIAAKLQAKSGPDLILAAAARMTFVLGEEVFSRQKIIDEMKTASAYFKAAMISNLSRYLTTLVRDGKLNEPSQGNFALTASAKTTLESRLV